MTPSPPEARPLTETEHLKWQLEEHAAHLKHWRDRAERAEVELRELQEALQRLIEVSAQYLDTGRGDLDGELERARAAVSN